MAINTEVDKLLKAKFIKEADYPDWIANVILVKKKLMEIGECAWTS